MAYNLLLFWQIAALRTFDGVSQEMSDWSDRVLNNNF